MFAKHIHSSSINNAVHFINSMFTAVLTQPFLTSTRLCPKTSAFINSSSLLNDPAGLGLLLSLGTAEAQRVSELLKVIALVHSRAQMMDLVIWVGLHHFPFRRGALPVYIALP